MGFNWINPLRIFQGVLSLAVLISAAVFVTNDQDGAGEGAFMIFVVRTLPSTIHPPPSIFR
jgi:hypothetical protein